MRVESGKLMTNGGWSHKLGDRPMNPVHHVYPRSAEPPRPDFAKLMRGWLDLTTPEKLDELAIHLEVSARSLRWLRVAWAQERECIAFPMYDGTSWNGDEPCGIRLRTMDGKKFAVTGSASGMFIPYGAMNGGLQLSARRIFICEGPTDTAACLDIGLFAIGRAACRGGEPEIVGALNQLCPREVVIVCDNDSPGVDGAKTLLELLEIRRVRLIPPGKDLRALVRDGGSASLIESMLKNLVWI